MKREVNRISAANVVPAAWARRRPLQHANRATLSARVSSGRFYSRLVLFFVYTSLVSTVFTEVRGDGFVALLGGYNLWSTDIALMTGLPMLIAAGTRPTAEATMLRIFAWAWLAVIALTLFRGVMVSPFHALFNFRPYGASYLALVAFSLRPPERAIYPKICWAFIGAGLALAILAVTRRYLVPHLFVVANLNFYLIDGRPMLAPAALIICEAIVFAMSLLSLDRRSRGLSRQWTVVLVVALIIGLLTTGQRTVAAGAAIGALLMFVNGSRSRFSGLINRLMIFGALPVLLVLATIDPRQLLGLLPATFSGGNATGDLQFRLLLWSSIVQNYLSWPIISQIFGRADPWTLFWYIGSYNAVDNRSAHNEILGMLLITGAAGVLLLVTTVVLSLLQALRAQMRGLAENISGVPPALILSLLVILVVYGASYEWLYEQGIVFGLCIAGFAAERRSRNPGRMPPRGKTRPPLSDARPV